MTGVQTCALPISVSEDGFVARLQGGAGAGPPLRRDDADVTDLRDESRIGGEVGGWFVGAGCNYKRREKETWKRGMKKRREKEAWKRDVKRRREKEAWKSYVETGRKLGHDFPPVARGTKMSSGVPSGNLSERVGSPMLGDAGRGMQETGNGRRGRWREQATG